MTSKNSLVEFLRKIPLFFYVLSFAIVFVGFIFLRKSKDPKELDKFIYSIENGKCGDVVILLKYNYRDEYKNSMAEEAGDSLASYFYKAKVNVKAKTDFKKGDLYKIQFLKDQEVTDGFVYEEYIHNDSCASK